MADFSDIDGTIQVLYDSVSGPAGPRDWTDERALFHPSARLVRTGIGPDGAPTASVFSPEAWIEDTAPFFAQNDFWEQEVARTVHRFGNIAHVLSVYEARLRLDDETPERRGVNSIQLIHDGSRWWVMSVIWDNEREGVRIPRAWLADH